MSKPTKFEFPGFAVAALTTICVVLYGVVKYRWLLYQPHDVQQKFSDIGDAVGPLGTIATVGALLAALWSVKLQREDLELQRQEMRDSTKELKRAARAQEELAIATRDAARAQHEANHRNMHTLDVQVVLGRTTVARALAELIGTGAGVAEKSRDEAEAMLRESLRILEKYNTSLEAHLKSDHEGYAASNPERYGAPQFERTQAPNRRDPNADGETNAS